MLVAASPCVLARLVLAENKMVTFRRVHAESSQSQEKSVADGKVAMPLDEDSRKGLGRLFVGP